MNHNFPKIIWQTHNYTFSNMPDNIKRVCANWINMNDGWDYKYVSDNEREKFVKKYTDIFPYYQSKPPRLQSDIWRYLVTKEYGGVYADIDSICILPLDYMLQNTDNTKEMIAVPKNNNGGDSNNCNYLVKENSQIMNNVVERMNHIAKNNKMWRGPKDSCLSFFIDELKVNKNVDYGFVSAIHSAAFHSIFPVSLEIDFFGEKIIYDDFIKNNKLKHKYW